ncbi:MAG TPA: hypothetical protein VFS21_26255, partial [Roseiflexaceae bacterium]|nr:hypothetical protein [Roseiflexaceae bacterium]
SGLVRSSNSEQQHNCSLDRVVVSTSLRSETTFIDTRQYTSPSEVCQMILGTFFKLIFTASGRANRRDFVWM